MLAKVNATRKEAQNVACIELVGMGDAKLPRFSAGAHVNIRLPDGGIRPYSLLNDPEESDRYLLGVLLVTESRGGSVYMHNLKAGDVVSISEPSNLFPLASTQQPVILIAAGIGITPILSMAHQLAFENRSFTLHYAGRSPETTAFRDVIRQSNFASRSHFYFSGVPNSNRLNVRRLLEAAPMETHVYACGPERLIEDAESAFKQYGTDMSRLHVERFHAPAANEIGSGNAGFHLISSRTGKRIYVGPDENVAQCMMRAGFSVSTSCEQGICGACITSIISGKPDHRDSYLTDQERADNKEFLPCCSRSLTDELTVDA